MPPENRDTATVDQSLLEKVPVFDQDYVATMSAFLDSAAIGTSGPQVMVNGVEVSSVIASASTIQEVRINQNPYSAEIARPGRGTIEIITKDPTSAYHGTFNFLFRDSVFNARDPFSLVRAPEQRRIFEGAFERPRGTQQDVVVSDIGPPPGGGFAIHRVCPRPERDDSRESCQAPSATPSSHFASVINSLTNHTVSWQYNEWDYPSSNQGVGGVVLPEGSHKFQSSGNAN